MNSPKSRPLWRFLPNSPTNVFAKESFMI
jgi:hypothetical protein